MARLSQPRVDRAQRRILSRRSPCPSDVSRAINGQTVAIDQKGPPGTVPANPATSDPGPGDTLSYSIVGGTIGGAFSIDAATGKVLATNPATPDFETNPSITRSGGFRRAGL